MEIFQTIGDALCPVDERMAENFVFLPTLVGSSLKKLDEQAILKTVGGYSSAYPGMPSFVQGSKLVTILEEIYLKAKSLKPPVRDPLIIAALVGEED